MSIFSKLPRLPEWVLPAVTIVISIVTMVNVVLLAKVSKNGTKARQTQCDVFPISIKLYNAAEKYHLITKADLIKYLQHSPTREECNK